MTRPSDDETNDLPEPKPVPSPETLGIYAANGHLVYGATPADTMLALDDRELMPIWKAEAKARGITFKQFKLEVEQLGSTIVKEAVKITGPAGDALVPLPGNIRLRYFRICVCWRWICIYVWVRI